MPIISGVINKVNTRSVKCWSSFDIDSIQILAITEVNLDFHFWINSAASKGFFHRLMVLCCVGT